MTLKAVRRWFRPAFHPLLECLFLGQGFPRRINGLSYRLAGSCWRAFPRDYEAGCFRFLEETLRPGDVAFDIGAHVGIFTVLMASRVGSNGRVVAFEPNPISRRLLVRHVALNRVKDRVSVEPTAIGVCSDAVTLHIDPITPDPGSSLYPQPHLSTSLLVPQTTVDDYCASHDLQPNLLKLDVEGWERFVMRGARITLATARPVVLCELHPENMKMIGETPANLLEDVLASGYEAIALDGLPLRDLGGGGHVAFMPSQD